jgi:CheY-like chemotaxis protein
MTDTEKGLILCIDDEPDVLNAVSTVLQSGDYETVCGENGLVGLELFEKNKDKLIGIVSDARMPKMGGLEFARKVRESGSQIPILLVTAYMASTGNADDEQGVTVKQYHDAGINAHLEKPFRAEDLLGAAEMVFGQ